MAGTIDAKLKQLGVEIPTPAVPVANYVGFVKTGNLVFTAGQVTLKAGKFEHIGKLGKEISVEQGQEAAKLCAINIIAQLKAACEGDLDRVQRIVKLTGFVNSTAEFTDQPKVINGASDFFVAVFGDRGKHARSAVSAGSLPLGVSVEIDCIAEIK
jgi:enamine deaminase RidA (YjgF/YER057c/UK114 family)